MKTRQVSTPSFDIGVRLFRKQYVESAGRSRLHDGEAISATPGPYHEDLLTVPTLYSENELRSATQFTLSLARSFGAQLTALITEIEPGLPSPPIEPDNMQGGVEAPKPLSGSERG